MHGDHHSYSYPVLHLKDPERGDCRVYPMVNLLKKRWAGGQDFYGSWDGFSDKLEKKRSTNWMLPSVEQW